MKLRNLFLIIFGALLFISILNFYFSFFRFPLFNVRLFDAIPVQSALIIECNDIGSLNDLGISSPFWSSVQKTSVFEKIQSDLDEIKNHLLKGEDSTQVFQNNRFIATLQMSSAKNADFLYIIDSGGKRYKTDQFLEKLENVEINKSVFLKEAVYEMIFADNQRFTISFCGDIILLARFPFMVEDAIAQLNKPQKSQLSQEDFQLVKKATKGKPEVSVYFNLKRIPQLLDRSGQRNEADLLKKLGSLVALNFWVDGADVLIDGSFVSNNDTNLKSGTTQPTESKMYKVIPDNCSFIFWQSKEYKKSKDLSEAKDSVFEQFLEPWIGDESAIFYTESRKISLIEEQFFICKADDIDLANQLLNEYSESLGELYDVDYQTFTINKLFSGDLLERMPLFENSGLQNPFFTMIEGYVIFSNSRKSLEVLIDKHILNQTLSNDASFLQFKGEMNPASNTFLFCNTSLFMPFLRHFSSELGFEQADPFFDILYNFKTLGVQFEQSKKVSSLAFYLNASASQTSTTKVIWTANLSANAIIPPAVLKNTRNQQNEIFVQDENHKIYLFDRNGKLIWERFLKAPILSKIHEIEYYDDGENHILFNTKDDIYLIDHEGKDVGTYPLKLPVSASNGLCVIDFEKDKNYKFFIGAKNGSAYAFEKTGVPLEGWNPKKNIGKLTHDIQHFQVAGNDYILVLNDDGDFNIFKRNGEKRFETASFNSKYLSPPGFQTSGKNGRIVLGNQSGKAQIFNLKGKHFNLYVGSGNDKNVQFLFADVIGDNRKDYMTLSGQDLTCYYYEKSDFKKAFSKQFEEEQDELFALQVGTRKKWQIGTLNRENKRIHLLDANGSIAEGFPLSGTSKFLIIDLFETDSKVLITALENSIYTCKID